MFFRGLLVTVLVTAVLGVVASFANRASVEADLAERIGTVYAAYGNSWTKVKAAGRDIELTGTAPISAAKVDAIASAEGVYGVRVVTSKLDIKPPVEPYTWSVEKTDKGIALGGHVPSTQMRGDIRKVAAKLYGDVEVDDKMVLADGAPEEAWKEALDFALQNVRHLGKGAVRISDSVVTIEGEAADAKSYNEIAEAFRGGPEAPDGYILASRVELPAVSPYVWSIEKVGKKINLAGHVPSVDAHGEVISRVRERFESEEISDKLKLASGEPDSWDETIAYSINQLKRLRAGKVSLNGDSLSISGEAVDNAAYDSIVKAAAPEGMKLKTALSRPAAMPFQWEAVWSGKRLDVTGYVPSGEMRDRLKAQAGQLFPGISLHDRSELASGQPGGFGDMTGFALGALKLLKSGTATISDKALRIDGEAQDAAALAKLKAMSAPKGAELTLNVAEPAKPEPEPEQAKSAEGLKGDADAVSPYVWSARRIGSEVILSGYAPSEDAQNKLLALAKRVFAGSKVADTTQIGAGAPKGWAAAAAAALQQLARLENGRVRLKDKALSVRGQTFLASGRDQLGEKLKTGLPEGFSGEADVVVKEAAGEVKSEECLSLVNAIISRSRITFETAKAQLTAEGRARLDVVAYTLNRCPTARIEISGHTDSDGDDASNMTLSQKRADTVRQALVAVGIDGGRMDAKGYGETRPVADNSTPENKAKNRRIEFKLEH